MILSNYYPGYWWDHTHLTIAVQPHPKATAAQVDAIRDAIATWSQVLSDCFDGLITLTDVTGTQPSAHRAADIVVHFVPTAGGVVLAATRFVARMAVPISSYDLIFRPRSVATLIPRNTLGGSPFTKSDMHLA